MAIHPYNAKITWTGDNGTGTSAYAEYERSHLIEIAGKETIKASSDKPFRGDVSLHNPEDLFLSAIATCHMLWYLHLCADAGIIVKGYVDKAYGELETVAGGSGRFVKIILSPSITVTDNGMIEKAISLHHKAHEMCFMSNSVNFEILVEPQVNI